MSLVLVFVQVSHCAEFQELLVRHLREHETFEEEEQKSTTKSSSPSSQRSAVCVGGGSPWMDHEGFNDFVTSTTLFLDGSR